MTTTVSQRFNYRIARATVAKRMRPLRSIGGRYCEVYNVDDIVNSAWLIWTTYKEIDKDTPIYHSVSLCLNIAWGRYWREVHKHIRKQYKPLAKRYLRARARKDGAHILRTLRLELHDVELSPKQRKLISLLCNGNTQAMCAKLLRVSAGRITAMLKSIAKAYAEDKPRKDTPKRMVRRRVATHTLPFASVPYACETNSVPRTTPLDSWLVHRENTTLL